MHSGLKWGSRGGLTLEDLKCFVLPKIPSQTLLYHKIGWLGVLGRFSLVGGGSKYFDFFGGGGGMVCSKKTVLFVILNGST